MGAALIPFARALAAGLIGTALATGVHFMTLTSGVARGLIGSGQGLPQTPGLPLTAGGLALECLIAALPVLPVVALTVFAGRFLMSLGFLATWAWGGARLGTLIAAASGRTLGWGDGFSLVYSSGMFSLIAALTAAFVLWILAPRPL
ncbi:hypothetical protein [Paracoccus sp. IB05]|uniref:hypothetical protein n=1 Tax=Paracoccus sp. IB05 TaxID=2779367 RepID=UPI0018E6E32D|nr:hypothetical protein [Paracoccus sp. IB05]MBJ2151720.1 hypothetical protein [Paracoccus sp. IB05]